MTGDVISFRHPERDKQRDITRLYDAAAEQHVLGALLVDNRLFDSVAQILRPADFGNGLHGRLYEMISTRILAGQRADPITLGGVADQDMSLLEYGGRKYLVELVSAAILLPQIVDYAKHIADLALRRELHFIGGQLAEAVFDLSLEKSGESIREEHEKRVFNLIQDRERHSIFSIAEAVSFSLDNTREAHKRGGIVPGIPTGLVDLDAKLGALLAGDLDILAGRTGMGKTAAALGFAYHAASKGYPTAFFSLEQTSEQLAQRLLASLTGVSSDKQRTGDLTDVNWRAVAEAQVQLNNLPLWIDETPALSPGRLYQRIRRGIQREKLAFVVVDHLQLMRADTKTENRNLELKQITSRLKATAKEFGIPILLLSQLSRALEQRDDKRPRLSDLRESGAIEEDADRVIFIFREEYYLAEPLRREDEADDRYQQRRVSHDERAASVRGVAEFIIGKNRHGITGPTRVHWDPLKTRFDSLADSLRF